jgi:hypothetical protein
MEAAEIPGTVHRLSQAIINLDANAANYHGTAFAEHVADLLSEQICRQVNVRKVTVRDVAVILASHGATWLTLDQWSRMIAARVKNDLTRERMGGNI